MPLEPGVAILIPTLTVSFLASLAVFLGERFSPVGSSRAEAGGERAARIDLTGAILLAALGGAVYGSGVATELGRPLLWAACGVYVMGAVTDLARTPRGLRAVAVVVAASYLAAFGLRPDVVKLPFSTDFVHLAWGGPLITIGWLTLCSSLFARAGTLPSVALGVGALASGTMYMVCLMQPEATGETARLLSLIVFAACAPQVGFARLLARGGATAGASTLGMLVGCVTLLSAPENTALLAVLLPLLAVGVPIFASTYTYAATIRRNWHAVAVEERRMHLHELLASQGYTYWQIVTVLLAGSAYLCGLALLLTYLIEVSFVLKLVLVALCTALGAAFLFLVLRLLPRQAADTGEPRWLELLGVRLSAVTMEQTLREAERFIREGGPHMIVTSDASGIVQAQTDEELRQIMLEADLVTPDGAGVVLAARLLNLPVRARCSGCDMVVELCRVAARLGRSVYLLGAAPGVAAAAAENLQRSAPGLIVAGADHGYFTPEQEAEIVERIRRARPAVLFVALGIPRQEKWIRRHLERLNVPVCVGVGGSFDVISGRKRRAPVWMQRVGLEWLYRTAREPRRIGRLVALPRIVQLAFAELIRGGPRTRRADRPKENGSTSAGDANQEDPDAR